MSEYVPRPAHDGRELRVEDILPGDWAPGREKTLKAIEAFRLKHYVGPIDQFAVSFHTGRSHLLPELGVAVRMTVPHRDGLGPCDVDVKKATVFPVDDPKAAVAFLRHVLQEATLHELDESCYVGDERRWDPHRHESTLQIWP